MGTVLLTCSECRTLFKDLSTAHRPKEALSTWSIDHAENWASPVGKKMIHGCDFTIALILNLLRWEHNPILTTIFSQGWACLWLSDVSHSLCRKLTFLTPVIMVLARNLLERCWYLVDLFFFPAAHEKQTQKYLWFSFLFFFLWKVGWSSLSFLHLDLFVVALPREFA